jgi:hypothetical protein
MDTVRFGRALGFGARSAAKTLIQAIDAANADSPSRTPAGQSAVAEEPQGQRVSLKAGRPTLAPAPSFAARGATTIVQQGRGLRHGARRFRDLALKPFVRLSGVVLLEVAGVFFAIFALYGFNTMWRVHAAWHAGSGNYRQFIGGALMLALFGYFSISSFLRARRRERGR